MGKQRRVSRTDVSNSESVHLTVPGFSFGGNVVIRHLPASATGDERSPFQVDQKQSKIKIVFHEESEKKGKVASDSKDK